LKLTFDLRRKRELGDSYASKSRALPFFLVEGKGQAINVDSLSGEGRSEKARDYSSKGGDPINKTNSFVP